MNLILVILCLSQVVQAENRAYVTAHARELASKSAAERAMFDDAEFANDVQVRLYVDTVERDYGFYSTPLLKVGFQQIAAEGKPDVPLGHLHDLLEDDFSSVRAYGAACQYAQGFVVGPGSNAGFFKFRDQMYDLARTIVSARANCHISVARRTWKTLSPEQREACAKKDPEYAAIASGAIQERLDALNHQLTTSPNDGELYFERGMLYRRLWNWRDMLADLKLAIQKDCKSKEYAQYVLGEHLASLGAWEPGVKYLQEVRASGIRDPRINRVRLGQLNSLPK